MELAGIEFDKNNIIFTEISYATLTKPPKIYEPLIVGELDLIDIEELAHLRKKRRSPLEENAELFRDDLLAGPEDGGKGSNFDTTENLGSATNARDRYKDKI